jgi:hypothetical protein
VRGLCSRLNEGFLSLDGPLKEGIPPDLYCLPHRRISSDTSHLQSLFISKCLFWVFIYLWRIKIHFDGSSYDFIALTLDCKRLLHVIPVGHSCYHSFHSSRVMPLMSCHSCCVIHVMPLIMSCHSYHVTRAMSFLSCHSFHVTHIMSFRSCHSCCVIHVMSLVSCHP